MLTEAPSPTCVCLRCHPATHIHSCCAGCAERFCLCAAHGCDERHQVRGWLHRPLEQICCGSCDVRRRREIADLVPKWSNFRARWRTAPILHRAFHLQLEPSLVNSICSSENSAIYPDASLPPSAQKANLVGVGSPVAMDHERLSAKLIRERQGATKQREGKFYSECLPGLEINDKFKFWSPA